VKEAQRAARARLDQERYAAETDVALLRQIPSVAEAVVALDWAAAPQLHCVVEQIAVRGRTITVAREQQRPVAKNIVHS